ncbi:MAG: serine hydrolase domain-containing protein [Candidatus Izemoplasmatales bacterium]
MLNDRYLNKIKKKVPTLQVYVESNGSNKVFKYSSTHLNQRFHSASVGKVFCASSVMKAIEEGHLSLQTKVNTILDMALLDKLFVYKGQDYQSQVTIEHLLSHTSGVNDYFEGKTKGSESFMKKLLSDPTHRYDVYELIDFTRKFQSAVGKPGDKFYYSDTGYNLLGLILEKIYKKAYHLVLRDLIINPLALKDTALCFYDPVFDQNTLAPIVFAGQRMEKTNALSCDFAGGGLQTTAQDLARFLKALFKGEIIDKKYLDLMMVPRHRFHHIMGYGLGLIEISFERIIPWMRHYPKMYGGLGSLSVHAFINPVNLDVIIINLGTPSKMRLSFKILVEAAKWLKNKS